MRSRLLVLVLLLVVCSCAAGEAGVEVTTTPTITTQSMETTTTTQATTTTSRPTTTITEGVTTTTSATGTGLVSVSDLAEGLFCRDLVGMGYGYGEAVAYWEGEGKPDRMDADRNGIPCETVYDAAVVVAYWGELPPLVSGEWELVAGGLPVSPACCSAPAAGPTSPAGPLPEVGWPADGYYDASVVRLGEEPSGLEVTIRRWVLCGEYPERCSSDWELFPEEAVTTDPNDVAVRWVEFSDPHLTVVLIPIHDPGGGAQALQGSGLAFKALLEDLDAAWMEWVVKPWRAGLSLEQIKDDLIARSADPSFPFGLHPLWIAPLTVPLGYRSPHSSYLMVDPTWMPFEGGEPWPPGYGGLYQWTTQLEVQNGKPVLSVWAGQIAG